MRTSESASRLDLREWIALAGVILAALVFTGVHVAGHTALSPVDEYVYIDYLDKVPTQGVVGEGMTGTFARDAFLCEGTRGFDGPSDLCGSASALGDDDRFPISGRTSAGIYSPAYFWITWVIARPAEWAGADPLTAFRLTGGVWLASAAALLFLALRRLRTGLLARTAGVIVMVGSLAAYWAHSYVSTDATALPAGAALLLIALRVLDGQRGGWMLPAVAALAALAKLQNISAVALTALFLVLASARRVGWSPRSLWGSRAVRLALAALTAALLAQSLWVLYRTLTMDAESIQLEPAYDFGVGPLLTEAFRFLPALDFAVEFPLARPTTADLILSGILGLVGTGGVIGLLLAVRQPEPRPSLARASIVAALVVGPTLALVTFVVAGYYVQLPVRYCLAMLPAFIACAVCLADERRTGRIALATIAAAGFAVAIAIPNA